MTRRIRICELALVVLSMLPFGAFGRVANAQSRLNGTPDSVPRELVEALLASPALQFMAAFGVGGGSPRVVVGTLPSGLAQRLWIPPGATVLGGLESSGQAVAVLQSSMPEDSLKAAYRREQIARGWIAPPARQPMIMSGFAPAPGSPLDPDAQLMFCSGGATLGIDIVQVGSRREIRASTIALGENLCATQRPVDMTRFGMRGDRPTLTNPPGTGNGFGENCAQWNSSGGGGGTKLSTNMTNDQVLAYYAKALADSGWTPANVESVSRTWTRRDSLGTLAELTLTSRTRASTPNCVEVEMRENSRRP
jgi:hypothetical protein